MFYFTFMNSNYLSNEAALRKIKHFCAYQERCHSEVKAKLYSFGIYKKDADAILAQLIEENYLNEERFATQYAGGRFRIKHWGRVKIKHELKMKQVSVYNIKKALAAIDEKEYQKILAKLFDQKLLSLKSEKNIFIKKRKLHDHLMQKGFEINLITAMFTESRLPAGRRG